ncbi:MAG TPA: aminotransferase class V-fold PLP-dependent enzyme [Methylomirabilota bacterium]|jgi:selenocysteine lyase/cysteine desulfurase|nr:aminotransferase class V-fold PLP-dependent enzyme [Methylomirabilota bacterium]
MPGLIPKTSFIGIEHVAHLATGGEAPVLRANLQAATRFLLDKGDGMPGRERFFTTADRTRAALAVRLGGRAEDIAFLGSASEGLHVASEGIDWRPGDNVVVGQSEFPSVLLAWQRLRPRGVEVRAVGREAVVAPAEFAGAVDGRTRVIAVSHVAYLTGARHDLRRLRGLADRVGARLVVDASHALGVVPVDGTLCDVVVACCYKWLLAVHGVGVFYVNSRRWPDLAAPWVGWHSTHREEDWRRRTEYRLQADGSRFEAGNPPFLPVYILDSALRVLDALDPRAVEAHVLALGGTLRAGLVKLGLPVLTPEAPEERAGNLVFATDRSVDVEHALRSAGVLVWSGDGRVRLSVHAYNDESDVARALAALGDLAARGAV